GTGSLGWRHLLQGRARRHAGTVLVVKKLDVAAEWDPGKAPARAVAIVEAEDLPPKADREGLDLDPAPTRHQGIAQLVNEHHKGKHEQNRKQDGQDVADPPQSLTEYPHPPHPPQSVLPQYPPGC